MSQERATANDDLERMRGELRDTVDLVCRSGGGVVFEMFPGALQFPGALEEEPAPAGWLDGTGPAGAPDAVACRALIDTADALAETLTRLGATARSAHVLCPEPVSS